MGEPKDAFTRYEVIDEGSDGMCPTLVGTFASRAVAEKAAAGRGAMGIGPGRIIEHYDREAHQDARITELEAEVKRLRKGGGNG